MSRPQVDLPLVGRPTAEQETDPAQYALVRAGSIQVGQHIVNHGDITRVERDGVFVILYYAQMVWELEGRFAGTGSTQEVSIVLHAADLVMIDRHNG